MVGIEVRDEFKDATKEQLIEIIQKLFEINDIMFKLWKDADERTKLN